MECLSGSCLIPEDLYLVAETLVIFAVDGELVDGVFHLTDVDDAVSSVDQEVYLGTAFAFSPFAEPG